MIDVRLVLYQSPDFRGKTFSKRATLIKLPLQDEFILDTQTDKVYQVRQIIHPTNGNIHILVCTEGQNHIK